MKYKLILTVLCMSAILFLCDLVVHAGPYGLGTYNSNTPYGGETSLSISAGTGINLSLNPSATGTLATASGDITVYSTDVVGYKLYIRALTATNMTQGAFFVPASINVTAASLATNTWGYNTDASTNFLGITTTNALLKDANGPFKTGDITSVTYGLNLDRSKPAGAYSSNVIYTAVPETP